MEVAHGSECEDLITKLATGFHTDQNECGDGQICIQKSVMVGGTITTSRNTDQRIDSSAENQELVKDR